MNRNLFIALIITLIGINSHCYAKRVKSDKLTPQWVKSTPVNNNPSQQFIVVMDENASLEEIENNKYLNLENFLEKEIHTKGSIHTTISNGNNKAYLDFLTTIEGGNYNHKQIDEYWEKVTPVFYRHYYLYAISAAGEATSNVELTSAYGARALWRSAIIPGWGQFHKGSKLKGGAMLGGVAALSIGAIFTNDQVAAYNKLAQQTFDVNAIRTYSNRASNYASVRNVCIGAAAALYIYNLVDAVVARGARRVVVKENNAYRNFSLAPTVNYDGSVGMKASYNF